MIIELGASEIRALIGARPFTDLNASERRIVASNVLRSRGDANSNDIANRIESNNANYQNFVVLANR